MRNETTTTPTPRPTPAQLRRRPPPTHDEDADHDTDDDDANADDDDDDDPNADADPDAGPTRRQPPITKPPTTDHTYLGQHPEHGPPQQQRRVALVLLLRGAALQPADEPEQRDRRRCARAAVRREHDLVLSLSRTLSVSSPLRRAARPTPASQPPATARRRPAGLSPSLVRRAAARRASPPPSLVRRATPRAGAPARRARERRAARVPRVPEKKRLLTPCARRTASASCGGRCRASSPR